MHTRIPLVAFCIAITLSLASLSESTAQEDLSRTGLCELLGQYEYLVQLQSADQTGMNLAMIPMSLQDAAREHFETQELLYANGEKKRGDLPTPFVIPETLGDGKPYEGVVPRGPMYIVKVTTEGRDFLGLTSPGQLEYLLPAQRIIRVIRLE